MRRSGFALPLLCALAPLMQAQDAGSAQVSGFVLDDATGRAIPHALVVLSTTGADPLDAVAYSDGRGAFSFTGLPARKYLLQVRFNGYEPGTYGARTPDSAPEVLVIKAGEIRQGLQVRLTAAGSLTGTVRDPDGDPVAGAEVQVLAAGFLRGKPEYLPIRESQTDPEGGYRFDVPPGRYIVAANARFQQVLLIQPEGAPEEPGRHQLYGVQFYSNADRLSAATRVTVSPGKELSSIDFRLPLRSALPVKGSVAVPADCEGAQVQVQALLLDVPHSMRQSFATAAMPPEYKFELPGLLPGSYQVVAFLSAQGRSYRGIERMEVGQAADQSLTISPEPGIELAGKVVIEGEGPGPDPSRVHLVPGDALPMSGAPPEAVLKPDGTFRFSDVLPGIWDIGVDPIPPGAFIKSMRLGDQDVLTEDMVIDSGTSAPLNIVVSKRGGVVEGNVMLDEPVTNPRTAPAKPVRAVVVLAPSGRFEHVLSFYGVRLADATGHFEFKGLTPGSYKLFAFDRMPGGGPENPDFLKPYADAGEPLEVVEGGRISKNVRATTIAERGR